MPQSCPVPQSTAKGTESRSPPGSHLAHQSGHARASGLGCFFRSFQQQFIMHLQKQTRVHVAQLGIMRHGQHGQFDDIRGRALNHRVYGLAARQGKSLSIGRENLGQKTTAAAQRGHKALAFCSGFHILVKSLQACEPRKVAADEILCLGSADLEFLGQLLSAHAVDQTEIDGLGVAALIRTDLLGRQIKNQGRRAGVNVFSLAEGVEQGRILGHMRQHAQLHL